MLERLLTAARAQPPPAWCHAAGTAGRGQHPRDPGIGGRADLSQVPDPLAAVGGEDRVAAAADGAGKVLHAEQFLHRQHRRRLARVVWASVRPPRPASTRSMWNSTTTTARPTRRRQHRAPAVDRRTTRTARLSASISVARKDVTGSSGAQACWR